MPIKKHVLCPERLRKVPAQFSWVDQRLVRHHYVERCEPSALALYLVLVTVADAEGLSYYSDASLERMLGLDHPGLCAARHQLREHGLVAYQKPLYQVLSLEEPPAQDPTPTAGRTAQCLSFKEVLHRLANSGGQP